jgi:hypothetical protein
MPDRGLVRNFASFAHADAERIEAFICPRADSRPMLPDATDVKLVSQYERGARMIQLRFDSVGEPPLAAYEHMNVQGYAIMAHYWDDAASRCGTWIDGQHHCAQIVRASAF